MAGSWLQKSFGCPYSIKHDGHAKISCEGFYDGCRSAVCFGDKKEFVWHARTYCTSLTAYRFCPMAQAIKTAKYDDEPVE